MTRGDCQAETQKHIKRVRQILCAVGAELYGRGEDHDQSKLHDPELETFVEFTPKLAELTYGSLEYKAALAGMKPALDHHYASNRHHPEHHSDGVDGMTLVDLVEMFADWKAASERHADGDLRQSVNKNIARFKLDPQLARILHNSIKDLDGV